MKKYFMLAFLLVFITIGTFATDVGIGLMLGGGSRQAVYYILNNIHSYSYSKDYTSGDFGLTGFIGWKYFDFITNDSFRWSFLRLSCFSCWF